MRLVKLTSLAALALGLLVGSMPGPLRAGDGAARRPLHHRHVARPFGPPPSSDAIDLGTLAPPTRLATLEQTYGDAAIARARVRRQDGSRPERAGSVPMDLPRPCEPRAAGPGGYRCSPEPGVPGYGLAYAFNPAYLSSPTVAGQDPGLQAPVLPAVTGLFYAINGLGALHPN